MNPNTSPIRVLGVTGTVQTGKSELRNVFEECGWVFHDLNDPQCDLRAKGTERYDLFQSRFPGCIREDGAKTGEFYRSVTSEFYHPRVHEDLELLPPVVHELIEAAGSQRVVLAWEYLPLIAHAIPLDHTLLFTSDHKIWMERLHIRARDRGVKGEITPELIRHMLDLLNVWPETIREQVEKHMAGKFTVVDVSPEDWGAQELRTWLLQQKS